MLCQRFAQTNHKRNITIKVSVLSLSIYFFLPFCLSAKKKIKWSSILWKHIFPFRNWVKFLPKHFFHVYKSTIFLFYFFFQFFSKKIGDFHERIQKEIQIPIKRHEPLSSLLHLLIWWLLWHHLVLVHVWCKIFVKSIF